MAEKWKVMCNKLSYDRSLKEKWKYSHQFVFSCAAAMYTFTTVMDFTRLVYAWGGLFVFQYLILLVTVGFPMMYVEGVLGQFSNCSPVYVFSICPAAVGLGIGLVLYAFITSLYHYVFLLYSLSYAYYSWFTDQPWAACSAWWNPSQNCFVLGKKLSLPSCSGLVLVQSNFTVGVDCREWVSSAEEFWRRNILREGRYESISWVFCALVILFWLVSYVVSSRGIAVTAKMSLFLVLGASVLLIILSIYSMTLNGASRGLMQAFAPKFDSIIKMNSWKEAAVQIIGSLNINCAILATFSSFNHFNHTLYRDLVVLCVLVVACSLCACTFVFCLVGSLAFKLQKTMDELMPRDTWSLCFVVIPQAFSNLLWPQLWSFLFYTFLSLLPFAFHFALIKVVLMSIFDGVPRLKSARKWICLSYCLFAATIGLTFSTQNGRTIYEYVKIYCLSSASMPFSFLFAVGKITVVTWIYGWGNFLDDAEFMLGLKHSWLLTVCLSFIDPFTIVFLFIHCACDFCLDASAITSQYPAWAQVIGWFLILMPVLPTVICFVCDANKHRKFKEGLLSGFEATHAWGPSNAIIYQDYYDWLRERPEYASSFSTGHKHRRSRRLTDDEIIQRRKAAVRRRLSVVTDSLMRVKVKEFEMEKHSVDTQALNESKSRSDLAFIN